MELSFCGGSLSQREIITHISFQVFCIECEWPPSSFNHPFGPGWWLFPPSQVMLNLNYTAITRAGERKKKKKKVIRALSPFIFLSYDMMNESLLFFCRHRLQLSKLSQKKKNLIKFKSVWLRQGIYQRMGLSFSLSTVSHDPSTPDLTMLGWPAPPAWWGSIPLKLLSCDSHWDMPERGPK